MGGWGGAQEPEGAGAEKGQAEGKAADASQNLRGGACAIIYLFSPYLLIARAERRGEPGEMQDHPPAGKQRVALPTPRVAERLLPPRFGACPRPPRPRPRGAAAARPAAPQPRSPAAPHPAARTWAAAAAQ